MADNVAVSSAASYTAAADQATWSGDTALVQLVKPVLVTGTEGAKTIVALTGDTEGALYVVQRRDQLRIAVASAGLTIATTAYVAGDIVGTQFTLANAARASGGTGVITSVILTSEADIIGPYDVVFTRESTTISADNAAASLDAANIVKVIGMVQLAGAFDLGATRIAQAYNIALPYDCSGSTNLYAHLITRAGHTFFAAIDDLQLTVTVERN